MRKSASSFTNSVRTASIVAGCVTAAMLTTSTLAFAAAGGFPGANGKPFQAVQEQIGDLQSILDIEIATLRTDIAYLQAQIDANAGDFTVLNSKMDELETLLIEALEAAIVDLQDQIDVNAGNITLLAKVDDLAGQLIAELEAAIANVQDQIDANVGDIETLNNRLTNLQSDLEAAVQIAIAGVAAQIDANAGDITALQTLESQLAGVKAELAAKQDLISACPADSAIRIVNSDGSVVCESDDASNTIQHRTVYDRVTSDSVLLIYPVSADCNYGDSGWTLTGGGFETTSDLVLILDSGPDPDNPNAWRVRARNSDAFGAQTWWAIARCIRLNP